MQIIELSRKQVKKICRGRMLQDFPADERKPLSMIMKELDRGRYICLGLVDFDAIEKAAEDSMRNALKDVMKDEMKEKTAVKEKDVRILGYAFFMKREKHYLFDYLAIDKTCRNQGIGSTFLKLISQYFADADSVIGEVENPDFAENEVDADLQSRRKNFYLRNGYVDTQVRARVFGVEYAVIEMKKDAMHTSEEITTLYQDHYQMILPRRLYRKMIRIHNYFY